MNHLPTIIHKFSDEITQYGITSVTVTDGRVYVESTEKIPYELFNAIEYYLL